MKARILIFEDNDLLRSTLKNLLKDYNYEVYTFANPGMCPQYLSSNHNCLLDDSCSDIIISDVNMPVENGLEFIKNMLNWGCKITFRALMSADWTESDLQYAKKIGCKVFRKPFDLEELLGWLENCQKHIDQNRVLSDW
ncbi:MAG: response regulator [Deltaproteobacteria bacterium]|nr:response regulator [Deltaproteobacteria bacterium]